MKRVLNIAFLLILVIGVSSCAKEELDAPSESADPQAIKSFDSVDGVDADDYDPGTAVPLPSGINDDGDNEDEGINNKGPSKDGN